MASIFDDLIPKTTTSMEKPNTGYTGSMFADLIPNKKQTKKELLASSFDYKSSQDIQSMGYKEKEAYKSALSKDIGSFMPFSSAKEALPKQSRPMQEYLEKLSPEQQEQYKTKYRELLNEEMKKTTYTERIATAVPNYFLAERFQDPKSPVIRALNFDEIQILTPQERKQYKELLKKDIFDGLADTTLTPEHKKVLDTTDGEKTFSFGNPLKLNLELNALLYGLNTKKLLKEVLNNPIGKEAMLSVAEHTENLPIKLLAKIQEKTNIPIMGNVNVGAEYDKILNAWIEAGTNPDAPAWKRFLFMTQSTLPQTALGVLLNVSANYVLPGAGNALSGAYWMALSGSEQIQRRGKIYSINNLAIDVALDSVLGNSIEGIFKRGAKDILIKEMGKNGVIEGGTEVSQTLLKYANDWAIAPNDRAKKEIIDEAVKYVKGGDMFMEFASSFASGAVIGGAGNVVDAKIRPQAKIDVGTDMGVEATEMAQETIETPQQVETPVKDEIEIVEQLRGAKGKTADDIMKTFPNIKLTKAVGSKDVYGNKIEIKKGEKLTPYEMKDGKILLQDGETYLVSKNQFQNIKGNSVVAEGKPFAPELEELEESVSISNRDNPYSEGNKFKTVSKEEAIKLFESGKNITGNFGGNVGRHMITEKSQINNAFDFQTQIRNTFKERYASYQLPGGENYKEILIKAPKKYKGTESGLPDGYSYSTGIDGYSIINDKTKDVVSFSSISQEKALNNFLKDEGKEQLFKSSHWDEPNIIAHLRLNERTYNGKKVTFMEELQSDWAKHNRELEDAAKHTGIPHKEGAVPSHALLKKWQELSIKRALIEAVNDKSDYFAWITGEQTSARYNLATHIDSIQWRPFNYKEGKLKDIRINPQAGRTTGLDISIDEMGIIKKQSDAGDWVGKKLDEVLGKGLADKIMEKESGTLSGEGLKFGGEWASNLYDKQVKSIVEDLTGQKVEMIDLGLPIEKEKLFNIRKLANGREWGVFTYKESDLVGAFATQQEALDYVKSNTPSTQQQAIKLTPEVKNKIKGIAPKIKTSGIQTEKVERVVSTPKAETTPLEAKTTPKKAVPQGLMEEAKKYKSAEEFVKAQTESFIKKWTAYDNMINRGGANLSTYDRLKNEITPEIYRELSKYKPTEPIELYRFQRKGTKTPVLSSWSKDKEWVEDMSELPEMEFIRKTFTPEEILVDIEKIPSKLELTDIGEVIVKAKNYKNVSSNQSKSQLTDIWNRANQSNDLISEARKYKSADEFVNNLKPAVEDDLSDTKIVDKYKSEAKKGKIRPILLADDDLTRVLDGNHALKAYQELGIVPPIYTGDAIRFLQESPKAGELKWIKENATQLTDIWNKAQEQIIEKPKGKETKLGKSIALKAIKDKLIQTYEGVAEYTPTTIEKQAKMSNDLLQNDMEGVRQIFRGQRDLPKGLNPSALVVATEIFLKENKIADAPQIVSEMLNSNLVSESSVAGQTLRLLAERDQNSAIAKLQDIKKYREAKATKATNKDAKSVKKNIKKETTKNNLSKADQNWNKFLDSIQC